MMGMKFEWALNLCTNFWNGFKIEDNHNQYGNAHNCTDFNKSNLVIRIFQDETIHKESILSSRALCFGMSQAHW